MKSWICVILLTLISFESTFAAQIILKPNLNVQMQKQEVVNKENRVIERKLTNAQRLKELQASRNAPTTTTTPTTRITLRDKVLAGTAVTPTKTTTPQKSSTPVTPGVSNVAWVDMTRVRSEWLGWYNSTRTSMWLGTYSYDGRLDLTAKDWNIVFAAGKWLNHHRRSSTDSYYNFTKISTWFADRWVEAKVAGGATTTENVWYGYYRCSQSDCTDELIASIRSTYDFFMSEKGKSYDAHYRSIVQPHFTKLGLILWLSQVKIDTIWPCIISLTSNKHAQGRVSYHTRTYTF
jgi:hypothetical protein